MSKKETEFDRLDRMKKLEREAEITKRKNTEEGISKKRTSGKPKTNIMQPKKNWAKDYDLALEEED